MSSALQHVSLQGCLRVGGYLLAMPKRKDNKEERAIKLLEQVLDIDRTDRDALPGSAVKKVKEAVTIMRKRRPIQTPRE